MIGTQLEFGVTMNGLAFSDREIPSIDTRFRLAAQAGIYDYIEYSPKQGELDEVLASSRKFGMPVRVGSFFYTVGRDEPLLEWHMRIAGLLGADLQNIQIRPVDAAGRRLSDDDLAELFLRCLERGEALGVLPSFEVHTNMWSEEFDRVSAVAQLVARRGARFNLTLDHSHCVFKIGNPREAALDRNAGRVRTDYQRLDPHSPGNYYDAWLDAGIITHMHARAAAPNNPQNLLGRQADGSFGRGIQYPFVRPRPGEWHTDWVEGMLDCWKAVTRKVFAYHASSPASRLRRVSAEFIFAPDYGMGAGYAVNENNAACCKWLRQLWSEIKTLG